MHFEVLAPGLLDARPMPRLPALELLAARSRLESRAPSTVEAWLAEAFGLGAGPLPAGALTALGCGHDPGRDPWLRADPVHLAIGTDGASLTPASALELQPEEAAALVAALNAHFGGECEWLGADRAWCLRTAQPLPVEADAPAESAAKATDALPHGDAAARARVLVTEVQMLLHRHAVNEARERRGAPAVNSVWLWGAGTLPAGASARWQLLLADNSMVAGLARLAGIRHESTSTVLADHLDRMPASGRILCVLERNADVKHLEERWFMPLLAALRAERVGMVTLHVPDAGKRWEVTRADLRRFWRRPRPLRGTLSA